ncbi:hypothetical protein LTR94_038397, partial [Friedmanniomyces endolithicus]
MVIQLSALGADRDATTPYHLSKRDADDYRVGKDWEGGRRVPGSYKETETGTVGLSWVGKDGYLGAAFTKERG